MRIETTGIEGLNLLHWRVSEDARGDFSRTFCRDALREAGITFETAQANLSHTPAAHTLRGLHYQTPPHAEAKIVSCLSGRIFDVAVDLRPGSPTYRQWRGFTLDGTSRVSLYLAPGLAHGLLTLQPGVQVQYLMSVPYDPAAATGVRWNDPALAIAWPAVPALISDRDQAWPLLEAAHG